MKLEELVKEYIPDNRTLENISGFFGIFSDNTRLKIISILSLSSMCVGDIAYFLNCNQTTVSHQLGILRNAKIVTAVKNGKKIIYTLSNSHVEQLLEMGLIAIS